MSGSPALCCVPPQLLGKGGATVISLFAASLFDGSGVATTVAAPLAGGGRFGLLFATAAVVAVPLGIFAAWRATVMLDIDRKAGAEAHLINTDEPSLTVTVTVTRANIGEHPEKKVS